MPNLYAYCTLQHESQLAGTTQARCNLHFLQNGYYAWQQMQAFLPQMDKPIIFASKGCLLLSTVVFVGAKSLQTGMMLTGHLDLNLYTAPKSEGHAEVYILHAAYMSPLLCRLAVHKRTRPTSSLMAFIRMISLMLIIKVTTHCCA